MVSAVAPRSTASAQMPWSTGDSTVVRGLSIASSPIRSSTVPSTAVSRCWARRAASTKYAVVVLPLVPVMPTVTSCAEGSPYTQAATGPASARGSSATRTGTPAAAARSLPAASVSTATAPAAAACAANRAPCTLSPGTATSRSPGRASPEATVTPVTVSAGGTPAASSAKASARSATRRAAGCWGRIRPRGCSASAMATNLPGAAPVPRQLRGRWSRRRAAPLTTWWGTGWPACPRAPRPAPTGRSPRRRRTPARPPSRRRSRSSGR